MARPNVRWRLVAAFLFLAAACSGTPPADRVASDASPAPDEPAAASAEPDATDAPARATRGRTAGAAGATSGGSVAAPGEQPKVTRAGGVPIANLFRASEDRIGITKDEIRICMHAAFLLGDVFNNRKEDELVYWEKVNRSGGIFGRKVRVQFEDDAYNPNTAVTAAESCKSGRAFLILSGVGFDQIPQVREWAEQNRQLYFYTMATQRGMKGKRFSFAMAPTIETVGRQIAQYLLSAHKGKKLAVLSRNSTNWDGALTSFKAELGRKGVKLVYEKKVDNGQDYSAEIAQLRSACPAADCVVYANENVLNFVKLYQQADLQGYRPLWFNYGFQLTNDVVADNPAATPTHAKPAMEAWWPAPAFDLYNETKQPWWNEVKAMRDAYGKFCTDPCNKSPDELNDVDWQFWLAWKTLHRTFVKCGADCSRNRLVGMILAGYKDTLTPLCPVDWSRGDHHVGSHAANILRAQAHTRWGSTWKQVHTCRERF